jgi:hypothetical protein
MGGITPRSECSRSRLDFLFPIASLWRCIVPSRTFRLRLFSVTSAGFVPSRTFRLRLFLFTVLLFCYGFRWLSAVRLSSPVVEIFLAVFTEEDVWRVFFPFFLFSILNPIEDSSIGFLDAVSCFLCSPFGTYKTLFPHEGSHFNLI